MTLRLEGILVPVVTTFDATGDTLDCAAFAANARAHLAAGLDGIVVAGSTGEAPLLDEEERVALIETLRPIVPRDRWLVAGVGAESTRLSVERARRAAAAGADAVLVVAPHYYPESAYPAALLAHFTRVADESPVPVILYSIPKYMHFAIPPDVVHTLAAHANVIGIKDSGGDAEVRNQYLAAQSTTFTVLTGHGPTFASAIRTGIRGGILAVALFAPALSRQVWNAARDSKGANGAADALQARLTPVARDIVGALGVGGVKAALDAVGLKGGAVRRPLPPLSAAARATVASLLSGVGAG